MACDPDHIPVILYENSEVCVMPKDRYKPETPLATRDESLKKKLNHMQFQLLRNYSKPDPSTESTDSDEAAKSSQSNSEIPLPQSLAAFANNFLTSWFSSPKEETPSLEEPESFWEIYDYKFDSVLRVLPYTNPKINLPGVVQATTVFITESTYVAYCGDKEVPPCFVGVLEKYALPEKRLKKGANDNVKTNADSLASKNGDKANPDASGHQKVFDSICVTVMVLKSEENEFDLPCSFYTYKNPIVVPKELKRALNLEVGCLVHLKSVSVKPLSKFSLVFHPVTTLVSY